MKTSEVVRAMAFKDNELAITVDADYSDSFYKHLKSHKAVCTQPSDAAYSLQRIYKDESGKIHREEVVIARVIEASGTLKDFDQWIDNWVP